MVYETNFIALDDNFRPTWVPFGLIYSSPVEIRKNSKKDSKKNSDYKLQIYLNNYTLSVLACRIFRFTGLIVNMLKFVLFIIQMQFAYKK